jgi:hypothetical protein
MSDPVIAPSGISYDRISIEEWLSTNDTEPSTRSVLTVEQLYPNRYLKKAIEHYRNKYDIISTKKRQVEYLGSIIKQHLDKGYKKKLCMYFINGTHFFTNNISKRCYCK